MMTESELKGSRFEYDSDLRCPKLLHDNCYYMLDDDGNRFAIFCRECSLIKRDMIYKSVEKAVDEAGQSVLPFLVLPMMKKTALAFYPIENDT